MEASKLNDDSTSYICVPPPPPYTPAAATPAALATTLDLAEVKYSLFSDVLSDLHPAVRRFILLINLLFVYCE
jgi:hypothetical protein